MTILSTTRSVARLSPGSATTTRPTNARRRRRQGRRKDARRRRDDDYGDDADERAAPMLGRIHARNHRFGRSRRRLSWILTRVRARNTARPDGPTSGGPKVRGHTNHRQDPETPWNPPALAVRTTRANWLERKCPQMRSGRMPSKDDTWRRCRLVMPVGFMTMFKTGSGVSFRGSPTTSHGAAGSTFDEKPSVATPELVWPIPEFGFLARCHA